jgi:putative ABC transport system substrate-binding protein
MKTRREFLIAGGAGLCVLASPLSSRAQQANKIWRIGFFYYGSRQSAQEAGRYEAFLRGMRELGHVEGKTFVVEERYADSDAGRMEAIASELARLKLDVIVSTATPMHQVLLQKAAGAIPIVVTLSPDPVAEGLAKSLAHPGGNFTGLANITVELSQKYIELLAASMPQLSRAGVLWNPLNSSHPPQLKTIRAAAKTRGIQVFDAQVRAPGETEHAFSALVRNRVEAVIVPGDGLLLQQARQIAELAAKHRLPTLYAFAEGPEFGGLMSYGSNIRDNFHRAATFVDKIMKGAKPGDLPFEQPMTLSLVINRKTAKAIGFAIPQEMLLRAERVIE